MKKQISNKLAAALAFTFIAASFTGCGSNSNDTAPEYSNNYKNDAVSYAESDVMEAPADYDSEFDGDYRIPDSPSYNEEYASYQEGKFYDPQVTPLSTFSVDVDTASYSNVRRLIEDNMTVPEDAVRVEEFINYFDYNYPDPDDDSAFSQYVEIGDCPWNSAHKLIMVGIQGKRMEKEELPPSNLVFLIDSSGSMNSYDKLPLVQSAFSMLAEKLTENDRISIVTYAGSSKTLLKGAKGSDKDEILKQLYSITASGGTNGEGGIETAYELAEKYFIKDGNNRVILATDGDLNIGRSTSDELVELIEQKRDNGICLSVLGFGTGNYKDARMEALADNGNGNFSYIDSVDEARRVLVQEMSGTLFTIAKDVKVQVEFNPAQISNYRLIGYDNRLMDARDFYDNTKDAGEIGAGHSVTALYEVELNDNSSFQGVPLEFAEEHSEPATDKPVRTELCKLSVTYKDIDTNEDKYLSQLFGMEKYDQTPSDDMKLASAVTEFAMLLKNSDYKSDSSYDSVLRTVKELTKNGDEKVNELYTLVNAARNMYR